MPSFAFESPIRRIRLFGRPEAAIGERAVALPEKGFALVGLLAFAERHELDRDAVRGLLWETAPAERRAGNLRQLLLRLAQLTDGASPVVASDGKLRLAKAQWQVDAATLLDSEADATSLATDMPLDGVAVEGQAFEDWLGAARRRIAERRVAILRSALLHPDLGTGQRSEIAHKLVACDPLDEAGYLELMALHVEAGDRQTARRWWLECRRRLNEDLGIHPTEKARLAAFGLGLDGPAAVAAAPAETSATVGGSGVPSVVIMPPAVLPGNELLDRLGLAVLEEITLGLSQFGSFRVVAAHTSWQLSQANRAWPSLAAGRIDYAVTVGVRNAASPIGATCRLTKLATGEILWSTELGMRFEDARSSLDELIRRTVASLAAAVERAEGRLSVATPDATGYRMFLEGKQSLGTTGLESIRAARRWFRSAIKRCDEFSAAFAGLSRTLSMEWLVRGMTDSTLLEEALAAARRAQACDPASGRAMREMGFASLYLRRHEESLAFFAEGRRLAPHDADLLADYADALMHDGQPETAMQVMRMAKDLNPLGPDHYRWIEATILFRMEEYGEALRVLRPLAGNPATARLMAASSALAGDITTARDHAATVREHYPDFQVDRMRRIVPDRRSSDTDVLVRGLQLAGLD